MLKLVVSHESEKVCGEGQESLVGVGGGCPLCPTAGYGPTYEGSFSTANSSGKIFYIYNSKGLDVLAYW